MTRFIHLFEEREVEESDAILILTKPAYERLQLALAAVNLDKELKEFFRWAKLHKAKDSDTVLYEWHDTHWQSNHSLFIMNLFQGLESSSFRLVIAKVKELVLGDLCSDSFDYCVTSRVPFEDISEQTNINKETELCLSMN